MDTATLIAGWDAFVAEACAVRLELARQNEAHYDALAEQPDVPLTELLVRAHGVTLATPLAAIVDLIDSLRTTNREAERLFDVFHTEWKDYRWNMRRHPRVFDALFRARESALAPTAYSDQCFQHVTLDNMYDNQFWRMTGNSLPRQPMFQAMTAHVTHLQARAGRGGDGRPAADPVSKLIREQDRNASTADRERELERVRVTTHDTLASMVDAWAGRMAAYRTKMQRINHYIHTDLNVGDGAVAALTAARAHVRAMAASVSALDELAIEMGAHIRQHVTHMLQRMLALAANGGGDAAAADHPLFSSRLAQFIVDARSAHPLLAGDEVDDFVAAFRAHARQQFRTDARAHLCSVLEAWIDRLRAAHADPANQDMPAILLRMVNGIAQELHERVEKMHASRDLEPMLDAEERRFSAHVERTQTRDAMANMEVVFAGITALIAKHHAEGTSPDAAQRELIQSLHVQYDQLQPDAAAGASSSSTRSTLLTTHTTAVIRRLKGEQRTLALADEPIIVPGASRADDEDGENEDEAGRPVVQSVDQVVQKMVRILQHDIVPFMTGVEQAARDDEMSTLPTLAALPAGLFTDWHVTPTRLFHRFRDDYLAHPDTVMAVSAADAEGGPRAMWAALLRPLLRQPGTPKLDRLFLATHALVAIVMTNGK